MAIHVNTDLTADLGRIKAPTMLLLGSSGQLGYNAAGIKSLAGEFMQHLPQAELKTIAAGGGTYCHDRKTGRDRCCGAAVTEFLQNL